MKKTLYLVLLSLLLNGIAEFSEGAIIFTEIMYNPRSYDDLLEYIEIFNTGSETVSLQQWKIPLIGFTFPAGASIAPGAYKVICANTYEMKRAYNWLTDQDIFGGYTTEKDAEDCKKCLPNQKAEVTLVDSSGVVVTSLKYDVEGDWSVLANGFGSSLELLCRDEKRLNDPIVWGATTVPERSDTHVEYGGTPLKPPNWMVCLPADMKKPLQTIYFSEILYHPLGSTDTFQEEVHEYIELYNRASFAVDISYWRLVGDDNLRYTFPASTVIQPQSYFLVVKSTAQFKSVYSGITVPIYGDYSGELLNGKGRVALVDINGFVNEYIEYEDTNPWPRAADALGASPAYFPVTNKYINNLANYKYKSQTLSRRTWDWPTDKAYSWSAHKPSPGYYNLENTQPLLPVISKLKTKPDLPDIRATTNVEISLSLKPWPTVGVTAKSVTLSYFVDDVISDNPRPGATSTLTMVYNEQKETYVATIPKQAESSVVRYKIQIDFEDGRSLTSPDIKDPITYNSFFVFPPPHPTTPSFHLFMQPKEWNKLRQYAEGENGCVDCRRVMSPGSCTLRKDWDGKVKCTVVHTEKGEVYEGFCRYQGSRYNRANGVEIGTSFPRGPPGGLKAYSYHITIPNYGKIDGSRDIVLHKMYQGCPMYETPLLMQLMEKAGVMGSPTSFARLHINGAFFRYMMVVWPASSDWVDRWIKIQNRNCLHQSTETTGHLFKATGLFGDEGPFGTGDWRKLSSHCGYDVLTRYAYTYERKTNDWANSQMIKDCIDNINDNILTENWNSDQRRQWIKDNVDLNLMLNYIVIINYAGTWDQVIHNQIIYRRQTDGKFSWHPWDADALWNGRIEADLYAGDTTQTQLMRRAVIKNFKRELEDRFRIFQATLHSKSQMKALLDGINAQYDRNQANEGYGKVTQDLQECYNHMSDHFNKRWDWVNSQLGKFPGDAQAEMKRLTCPDKPEVNRIYTRKSTSYPPGPPLAFSLVTSVPNVVTLSWYMPNLGYHKRVIQQYNLERSASGEPWVPLTVTTTPVIPGGPITYTDTNIQAGKTYNYRVSATVGETGTGPWSTLSISVSNTGQVSTVDPPPIKDPPAPTTPPPPLVSPPPPQPVVQESFACENEYFSPSCSGGTITIQSAIYGRTSNSICSGGNVVDCRSDGTNQISNLCNGQSICSISASNANFGDPCLGTKKYLQVKWTCSTKTNAHLDNAALHTVSDKSLHDTSLHEKQKTTAIVVVSIACGFVVIVTVIVLFYNLLTAKKKIENP